MVTACRPGLPARTGRELRRLDCGAGTEIERERADTLRGEPSASIIRCTCVGPANLGHCFRVKSIIPHVNRRQLGSFLGFTPKSRHEWRGECSTKFWLTRPIAASRTPHSYAPPSRRTRLARSRWPARASISSASGCRSSPCRRSSHSVSDHTWVLALIEMRFMVASTPFALDRHDHPHLTRRDRFAHTLEDMFDFENSPSLNTPVSTAVPPANDCGPFSGVSSTP
jgi:hypothetical protein